MKHRVECKEATVCVSITTFLLGPVEAPAEFVDTEHPRLYLPIVYEDYRKLRVSKKLQAGEALALLSSHS